MGACHRLFSRRPKPAPTRCEGPVRGLHQGQRSQAPRQQAGHMTASRTDQDHRKNPLQKGGRPHMSPFISDGLARAGGFLTQRFPSRFTGEGDREAVEGPARVARRCLAPTSPRSLRLRPHRTGLRPAHFPVGAGKKATSLIKAHYAFLPGLPGTLRRQGYGGCGAGVRIAAVSRADGSPQPAAAAPSTLLR
jgi:hypothetical protein